jgi:hypothetical protein
VRTKLSNLLWDAVWEVTVFNIRLGRKVLVRLDRTLSPTAEALPSRCSQSGFESQRVHADLGRYPNGEDAAC